MLHDEEHGTPEIPLSSPVDESPAVYWKGVAWLYVEEFAMHTSAREVQ